ncbi:related to RPB8 - DNA-directed RNA polymerase I, II, III 16 KD subunit [Melanopsichium pennsylvanicum]|uniref:DNA-directed RNA polymerases I, II, and III subunit RPABC3 n=2 Tax=Melanopsichium pennsylvanicum TaxID=63383 RepID=A0AAJ5C2Y3_9BASI|nr:related to RPB8-DNA-directed RNA polymerase I, II, III 16 KD subunit [Melanopsichium pennsylvanicum 4]SNX82007.1 related to RPB8 - DNA-directed RNA polymerase I, II, III 16 KD subunit [Melanopsichium pennsylvanicum]
MDPTNLFDTQFVVNQIDPDGKKFDRVSRIIASSPSLEMTLSIDIATDVWPISEGQQLTFQLASTLKKDTKTEGADGDTQDAAAQAAERDAWRLDQPGNGGIADDFDYVMYGKIYRYDEKVADQVTVYGSFGGLMMALTGNFRHMSNITIGSNVYLLMR